jgi:radical SAM superfamily enzyme YgiQ (UPF0313 family)
MNIVLIYPPFLEQRVHEEEIAVPPIGLYYVGATLIEAGHTVEILNWHDRDTPPVRMEAALAAKEPDVIGISLLHANRWGAIEVARMAKRILTGAKVILGGVGATFLWEHLLTHVPEVDFIVMGEGERTFPELLAHVERGTAVGIEQLPGIAFRQGGRPYRTPPAEPVEDLDRLPDPARHFTFQHVASSRGCPGKCRFCGSPQFWGPKVRFHSPEYFVHQLELLKARGVSFFFVSDDTFTLKKDRVIHICREILRRRLEITWVAISRVDTVDDEVLSWMRRAGCIQVSYGIESGSQKIRRSLGKNIRKADIKRAFALTTKYGMLARAYFIYGCPGETWETIRETLDLIREIRPLSVIFYILDVFPGTRLYEEYRRRAGVNDEIWLERIEDILYFETDPNLSKERVLAFGERLRTAYHEMLPSFAEGLELVDLPDFPPLHADFLSRFGLTFSQGDYASIPRHEETASRLFDRALSYHPDHRAYLGLGMLKQRNRDFRGSVEILSQGLVHHPESESLHLCAGISRMNLGDHEKAIPHFLKFPNSKNALHYLVDCYIALGDKEKAAAAMERLRFMKA